MFGLNTVGKGQPSSFIVVRGFMPRIYRRGAQSLSWRLSR
jgi:hypothetical protein